MRSVLHLWNDDRGNGTLTAEWLFLMAIMVVGLTGGLIGMRDAILNEMQETTDTITSINRGFRMSARSHSAAATDGTSASDTTHTTGNSGASASAATISD
jgi:hypothetical protein